MQEIIKVLFNFPLHLAANCVYPIIGVSEYGWSFIGSEISAVSLASAQAIVANNELLKNKGRLLVRPSGTEPKVRIMGESNNKKLLKRCIKLIRKSIN